MICGRVLLINSLVFVLGQQLPSGTVDRNGAAGPSELHSLVVPGPLDSAAHSIKPIGALAIVRAGGRLQPAAAVISVILASLRDHIPGRVVGGRRGGGVVRILAVSLRVAGKPVVAPDDAETCRCRRSIPIPVLRSQHIT